MHKVLTGCIGFEDLKKKTFYRDTIIELIATGCLLFGIGMMGGEIVKDYSHMHLAVGTGFTVATIIWAVGSTSGGLIDPAVTVCCFLTGHVKFIKCLAYIASQCLGAYLGTYLARSMAAELSDDNKAVYAMTRLHPSVKPYQGVIIEMVGTGMKATAIFATLDPNRKDLNGSGPLAVGISCMVALMFAIPYTGCSINPARSFGPALLSGDWEHQWVFWVGPIAGAIIGMMCYELFCKSKKEETLPIVNKAPNTTYSSAIQDVSLPTLTADKNYGLETFKQPSEEKINASGSRDVTIAMTNKRTK